MPPLFSALTTPLTSLRVCTKSSAQVLYNALVAYVQSAQCCWSLAYCLSGPAAPAVPTATTSTAILMCHHHVLRKECPSTSGKPPAGPQYSQTCSADILTEFSSLQRETAESCWDQSRTWCSEDALTGTVRRGIDTELKPPKWTDCTGSCAGKLYRTNKPLSAPR